MVPGLIEAFAFFITFALNSRKKYFEAAMLMLLTQNLSAVYFGILLGQDDEMMLHNAIRILTDYGCRVILTAQRVETGIELAKRECPDFILLDVQKTIGVQAYLDLIEIQLDYSLPNEVMKSDYMKELYRLTARIFGWCNDFHSVLKDVGREPLNLVLVLQNEFQISLEDANAMAIKLHDEDVQALCNLQADMPDFGNHHQQVQLFVYYLGVMIHGQNEWYLHDTLRYKKGGHPEIDSFKE